MSDMSSHRITVRLPPALQQRVRRHVRGSGKSESELIREALEAYLSQSRERKSAYELAEEAGLIGCVQGAPRDLSTNRRYFANFGKNQ